MKAWEIWSYQPAGWPEPHPAVIVSGPARVAHKRELNIITVPSARREIAEPKLPAKPRRREAQTMADPFPG
jgi:hypothetical protein